LLSFPTYEERPDLVARWDEARDPWEGMEWMYHDPVCELFWPRLTEDFGDLQFLVYDEESNAVLGEGRTIPFHWSGKDEELPDGVDEVFPMACEDDVEPNTLCAILAVIDTAAQARGLSAKILKQMGAVARAQGLGNLVAPVRPNYKSRYPLAPMDRYALWRRDDGLLYDPWLRTHERLGARYAGICPHSNVFEGTVAQWQEWTGLVFFESGDYLAPRMMNPFQIDLDAATGTYVEANVWMVHELDRS
jgi:hypothetical protein